MKHWMLIILIQEEEADPALAEPRQPDEVLIFKDFKEENSKVENEKE